MIELTLSSHEIFDAQVAKKGSNHSGYDGTARMQVNRVRVEDYMDGRAPQVTAYGRFYKADGDVYPRSAFAPLVADEIPHAAVKFAVQRIIRTLTQGVKL